MQALLGGPRAGLSESAIRASLEAPRVAVGYGADLLDAADRVIGDLTPDLREGSVAHANYADVHGTCDLSIYRELAWGRQRVRPWQEIDGARFYLGVYLLTTPKRSARDESVTEWQVRGYDKLSLLQGIIGDTWVARSGARVLDEVRRVLVASGVGGAIDLSSARADAVLAKSMTWPIIADKTGDANDGSPASWLRVANDLLGTVGYRGLWADEVGTLRSEPYVEPRDRPSEWTFSTDPWAGKGVVGREREETRDLWGSPNRWRFIRTNATSTPREGAGQHTIVNQSEGPTSVDALGRRVTVLERVEAQSQADLVSQARRRANADMANRGVIDLSLTGPFPVLGHFDRLTYEDAALGGARAMQVRSWTQTLSGASPTLTIEDI